jgi:hypothetical protein
MKMNLKIVDIIRKNKTLITNISIGLANRLIEKDNNYKDGEIVSIRKKEYKDSFCFGMREPLKKTKSGLIECDVCSNPIEEDKGHEQFLNGNKLSVCDNCNHELITAKGDYFD